MAVLEEVPRSSTAVAKAIAEELGSFSETLVVLDLATPYLRDAWIDLDLAKRISEQLSLVTTVRILVGTLVDPLRPCLDKIPTELSKRVVELENLGFVSTELSMYGKKVRVRVACFRGPLLVVSIPRTQPYPPIAYPSYLLAKYLMHPSDRWALDADPRRVEENVAMVMLRAVYTALAVVDLGKGVLCDGPIHGCVERLGNSLVVGSSPAVDIYEHLYLGLEPPRGFPWSAFAEVVKVHRVLGRRVKLHSLSRVFSRRGAYHLSKRKVC